MVALRWLLNVRFAKGGGLAAVNGLRSANVCRVFRQIYERITLVIQRFSRIHDGRAVHGNRQMIETEAVANFVFSINQQRVLLPLIIIPLIVIVEELVLGITLAGQLR